MLAVVMQYQQLISKYIQDSIKDIAIVIVFGLRFMALCNTNNSCIRITRIKNKFSNVLIRSLMEFLFMIYFESCFDLY